MNLNEYQEAAKEVATHRQDPALRILHPALGLNAAAGKLASHSDKFLREARLDRADIRDKLGDALWFLSQLASDTGFSLEDIAKANLQTLRARKVKPPA